MLLLKRKDWLVKFVSKYVNYQEMDGVIWKLDVTKKNKGRIDQKEVIQIQILVKNDEQVTSFLRFGKVFTSKDYCHATPMIWLTKAHTKIITYSHTHIYTHSLSCTHIHTQSHTHIHIHTLSHKQTHTHRHPHILLVSNPPFTRISYLLRIVRRLRYFFLHHIDDDYFVKQWSKNILTFVDEVYLRIEFLSRILFKNWNRNEKSASFLSNL